MQAIPNAYCSDRAGLFLVSRTKTIIGWGSKTIILSLMSDMDKDKAYKEVRAMYAYPQQTTLHTHMSKTW